MERRTAEGWAMKTCTLCGGPLGLLGMLGKLAHYQCQDCGAMFSCESTNEEQGEQEEE